MNENMSECVAVADRTDPSWEAVVDRYAPAVCAVARAYGLGPADTGVVSQLVWLRLADDLDLFPDAASLRSWLLATTRRECVRRGYADPPGIDVELRRIEYLQALRDGMAELAPEDRDFLTVVARDPAISDDRLGALLNIPVADVGPLRSRTLARLRATPSMRTRAGGPVRARPPAQPGSRSRNG